MREFPPNTPPQVYAVLAVAVGSAIVGDFNVNEQNTIGNWIILVGQYLLTCAAQQQMIEGRIEKTNININSQRYKSGGSYFEDGGKSQQNQRDEVDFLLSALKRIEDELNTLKKEN